MRKNYFTSEKSSFFFLNCSIGKMFETGSNSTLTNQRVGKLNLNNNNHFFFFSFFLLFMCFKDSGDISDGIGQSMYNQLK